MDKNKINREFKKYFKVKSIKEFGGTIMIEFRYEPTQTEYWEEKYGIDIEEDGYYDLTAFTHNGEINVYTGTAKNEKDLAMKVLKHAKEHAGVNESVSKFDQLYTQYLEENRYRNLGKLRYHDQVLSKRVTLSKTLMKDLGLDHKDFTVPHIGFDNIAMYVTGGGVEGTIKSDALSGKYTYDELLKFAKAYLEKI